jgi:hypothetical protein
VATGQIEPGDAAIMGIWSFVEIDSRPFPRDHGKPGTAQGDHRIVEREADLADPVRAYNH